MDEVIKLVATTGRPISEEAARQKLDAALPVIERQIRDDQTQRIVEALRRARLKGALMGPTPADYAAYIERLHEEGRL